MPFKCGFNLADYKDILPPAPQFESEIINIEHYGHPEKCIWTRVTPQILTPQYREQEVTRILKTGAWIIIKDEPLYLPPNYYFALKYAPAGISDFQFRLKRLMHVYHKMRVRNNAASMGSLTIKNRAEGETTMSITDAFWECLEGLMNVGMVGIQSKTRADAIDPCWRTMKALWLSLPQWIKDELCSDFASGKEIQSKIKFERGVDEVSGKPARNIVLEYFPAVYNAMDGRHNMKKCILDEVCKWVECDFYAAFTNYSKFIMPGRERRGLFDIFSSPSDTDNESNKRVHELWKRSDSTKITEMVKELMKQGVKREDAIKQSGTTASKIHRYHANPLHGIEGFYDEHGDADGDEIYEHIMAARKVLPADQQLGEVRAYPLNEDEMFGSFEGGNIWDNSEGIKKRKIYLSTTRFKDEKTKEPIVVRGNLEWKDGLIDNPEGVEFRQADVSEFDVIKGRFSFPFLPQNLSPLKMKWNDKIQSERATPPSYMESCLGIDPFGKRYHGRRFSNGAMVCHKFLDILNTGIYKCPTMTYCNRPFHEDIFFEDAIKAAIFTQSMVQFENVNDRIGGYFEDRGYKDWLLVSIGEKKGSNRLGDAPTTVILGSKGTRTSFFDEGVRLLNALMNLPLNPGDPYYLERVWCVELLEDVLKLNPNDTHEQDLSNAWIQAVLGAVKMMYKKVRQQSSFNNEFVGYFSDII